VRRAALAHAVYDLDPFVDNPLRALSFAAARFTALQAVGRELFLLVWPRRLSCDYSYDQIPLFPWTTAGDVVVAVATGCVLVALVALVFLWRVRRPAAAFLIGFLVVSLLPTSNLLVPIGSIMAERFLYLPLAAFAGLLAIGIDAFSRRAGEGRADRVALAMVGVLVLVYSVRTSARNRDWTDDETLFRAARPVSPRSYRVHLGLAQALLAGRPTDARLDEAIAEAEEAERLLDARPLPPIDRSSHVMLVLASACLAKGDRVASGAAAPASSEAARWYLRAQEVLERATETDRAVNERVHRLRLARGDAPSAIRDVGLFRIYDVLGTVYMRLGQPDRALEPFVYLRHLTPESTDGYMLAAWALAQMGRLDEAIVAALEAWILQEPNESRVNLVALYRHVDPATVAFHADGRLNLESSRVRGDAARACAALVEEFRSARLDAAPMRSRCVEQYGWVP
jgi:tetratricopeptide (TPR) repeat protein